MVGMYMGVAYKIAYLCIVSFHVNYPVITKIKTENIGHRTHGNHS